jgi:hypothetical protein
MRGREESATKDNDGEGGNQPAGSGNPEGHPENGPQDGS